jgi:hypothetical protein
VPNEWWFREKKVIMLLNRLLVLALTLMPFSILAQSGPGGIGTTDGSSSLELWLSANKNVTTNSGDVSSWGDRSGNNIDASTGTAPNFLKASNSSITGKPTIEFDGTNSEYLDLSADVPTGSNGEVTVFIVFKPSSQVTSSASTQVLMANDGTGSTTGTIAIGDYLGSQSETISFTRKNSSSNDEGYYHSSSFNGFLIHNFDYDGTSANYYQDNGSKTLSTLNSFSNSESLNQLKRIGADASTSNPFSGEIAEIIIYSKKLGNEERELVANYLDAKYQLNELANNDYFINDTSYNNEPIGITANSAKAIEGGGLNIHDVNNNLASGDHIFAAHEGSSESSTTSYGNGDLRWQRNWKIDISTSSGGSDRVDITFNFDEYGEPNTDPTNGTASDYEIVNAPTSSFSQTGSISPNNQNTTLNSNSITFSVKIQDISKNGPYFTLGSQNTTNSPLPVEWQYFKGEEWAQGNVLKWGTASETNARHFEVQRSGSDKEDFRTIATIQAAGTTIEPQDYQYVDQVGNQQTYYYRLKQVDLDGSFEYSNIIALEREFNKAESQLNLLKNPIAQGQPIRYEFTNPSNEVLTVRLYDATGQLRDRQRVSAQKGAQILRTGELSSGVYWLQIRSGERSFTKKVVIY